jgi:hypothetical protein
MPSTGTALAIDGNGMLRTHASDAPVKEWKMPWTPHHGKLVKIRQGKQNSVEAFAENGEQCFITASGMTLCEPTQNMKWMLDKLNAWNCELADEDDGWFDPSVITTPVKKRLPPGWPGSWEDPPGGITVSGVGTAVRNGHCGGDGGCSIDLRLTSLTVDGKPIFWSGDRYMRLECASDTYAKTIGGQVRSGDKMIFGGPVKIDHDGRLPGRRGYPWLEVHPDKDFSAYHPGETEPIRPAPGRSHPGGKPPGGK